MSVRSWLRRSCRQVWQAYRNCLDANLLLRAWRPRKRAQPPPASNVSFVDRLRALPPEQPSSPLAGMGLAVAATVSAFVVTGYWYAIESRLLAQEHVFITGAAERTAALSDGSLMSLSAHSILTVDDTGPQRVAFQEAGEIIYKVRGTPARPFILQTIRATAIVVTDATFRVVIGSKIEFEVLAGVVEVALRGAKPNAPVRRLRKGDSLRVSVDGTSPVFADCRRSVSTSLDG